MRIQYSLVAITIEQIDLEGDTIAVWRTSGKVVYQSRGYDKVCAYALREGLTPTTPGRYQSVDGSKLYRIL